MEIEEYPGKRDCRAFLNRIAIDYIREICESCDIHYLQLVCLYKPSIEEIVPLETTSVFILLLDV